MTENNNFDDEVLGKLAAIYNAFVEKKGMAWCRHWEGVPLNQLTVDGVNFRMPNLEDCYKAKLAIENKNNEKTI